MIQDGQIDYPWLSMLERGRIELKKQKEGKEIRMAASSRVGRKQAEPGKVARRDGYSNSQKQQPVRFHSAFTQALA